MNKDFMDTIYLFTCGARGIEPDQYYNINLKEVYSISKSQGIWEIVFLAVIKLYEKNVCNISSEIFDKLNTDFLSHCVFEYERNDFIHRLMKVFNDNQLEYCLLKGESISRFYVVPVSRISGDVDILVDPKKLRKYLKIMKRNGFHIGEIHQDSHHIECIHPKIGLVEIHTHMYGRRTEDICFRNKVKYEEDYVNVVSEDGFQYKTLGITDNFVFLFLHFIKHFLSFGAGIRQLMDVLLYIENNYEEIDWKRAISSLSSLGFEFFFKNIIEIGKQYFGFRSDILGEYKMDNELAERILKDIHLGGLFGHDDKARLGFYNLYLDRRLQKYGGESYNRYENRRKIHRLFPDRKFMEVNFQYVRYSIVLLPIAWGHRIIKSFYKKNKVAEDEQLQNLHEDRLKLIQDLKMI